VLLSVLLSALFDLLSGDCRCLGALCVMMAAVHIDKGRLSFCFKSLGNSIMSLSGAVRVCSEHKKNILYQGLFTWMTYLSFTFWTSFSIIM